MANGESNEYERRNCTNLYQHKSALHVAAGARSQAVNASQCEQCDCGNRAVVPIRSRELPKIRRKDHCHRSHAAGLRDQKQSPSVHECHRRMICFAEIDVLATCRGQECCKLSTDKSSAHHDTAAEYT